MTSEWYCQFGDRIDGTFTVAELLRMASDGTLAPADKVRRGKTGEWIEARRLPGMQFPDDLERRSTAAEPPPVVRPARRRRDEADDAAGGDLLSRDFDGPAVRGERLLALTGGEHPVERFRTCKVTWGRKQAGALANSQNNEYYADLIFTDCGALVAKHARLPKHGEGGTAAHWAHAGGLIGLFIYWIVESRRVSRERNAAEDTYFHEAEDWEGAKLLTLFRRVAPSEFLPADEITDVSFRKRGVLKFKFRGQWCQATPDPKMDEPEFRMVAADDFHAWLTEAAALRAGRTGGPPEPGPAALVEWSKRPEGDVPAWVVEAVERLEERWGEEPHEVVKWIPKAHHAELFRKLAAVDTPAATAWRTRLGGRFRIRGIVTLVIGVVIALVGIALGVLIASDNAGPKNDNETIGAVFGGTIALLGLLCTGWGLSVLYRYTVRGEHPPG
ncbi:MAG: GYF domain-containing protein [Gemmataceae bacterium]